MISGQRFKLPKDLVRDPAVAKSFFSLSAFESLSEDAQKRLLNFLPEKSDIPKEEIIRELLENEGNFHFGNPLNKLIGRMAAGELHPDKLKVAAMREKLEKRRYREKVLHERSYETLRQVVGKRLFA